MVSIKRFRGTKHYLMGHKDIDTETHAYNEESHDPATVRVKKRQVSNGPPDEAVQKKTKRQTLSSADLMGKLEEFSDVWNDCPKIYSPKKSLNSSKFKQNHANDYDSNSHGFKKPFDTEKLESETQEKHFGKVNSQTSDNNSWQQESKEIFKSPAKHKNIADKDFGKNIKDNDDLIKQKLHVSKKADEKRMKAVQEQIQLNESKKSIIKQALSALDAGPNKRINKKITFDDDSESADISNKTDDETPKSKSSGKKQLFEEDGSDNETELKINSQFEGKKGQKLLELQSKFASDSRFILDERFAESESESEVETREDEGQHDEKQKQYEILESIVGRSLKPRSDAKASTKAPQTLLLRFDPLREDHSQFIVRPSEPKEEKESSSSKKKKKGKKAKEDNVLKAEERPEVNIERVYKVKDELKEIFRREEGQGFSLLKLFGDKDPEEPVSRPEQSESVKKQKHKTKTPFKYDSSDSETEEGKGTKDTQLNEKAKDDKSETPNKIFSWHTSFFFVDDDPRFKEALEFLKVTEKAEDDESEFTETRKTLKDFLKRKYKNNLKNKGVFKKKLGGGKPGGVRKKKSNKS